MGVSRHDLGKRQPAEHRSRCGTAKHGLSIAELTDVVAELLVPLADRDEEKARELLARYRKTSLAP